ncbi:MAG: RpiB/LacA/LacB family sugar-phosphate isomerase [Mycoplasma sp.]|nr:RpiB/LacA/LacB family sugar-phosphate isomerase [Candidatus Hennigella equi]
MKIKVLVKENINKTYNVLETIKNNKNLAESQDLIAIYNDQNWLEIFEKAYEEFTHGKFRRFIIIDDYAYGPFLFISKQKGWVATSAFDEYSANLIRAHNNSKVCIIPVKRINPNEKLNNIINAFCVSEFEAGRHVTRLQILHGSMGAAKNTIEFSKTPNKTVVVGSDHAGFALKEAVKEHLTEKGYKVIDVGTNSLDSTHYSLFGAAIASHIPEASYAIGFCWTGMGMANSLNKFKGLRACVCMTPENAKVAREIYGANTLVMGSKFSNKEQALKTVDTYLETQPKANPIYAKIDDFGFSFDKNKFKEIKLESGIIVPKELL